MPRWRINAASRFVRIPPSHGTIRRMPLLAPPLRCGRRAPRPPSPRLRERDRRELCTHVGECRRSHTQGRRTQADEYHRQLRIRGRLPQIPTGLPLAAPASPMSLTRRNTAGCHGSWKCATDPSIRSAARVYCVRSLVPTLTKSALSSTWSARTARRAPRPSPRRSSGRVPCQETRSTPSPRSRRPSEPSPRVRLPSRHRRERGR